MTDFLPEYSIKEILYQGKNSTVYKAIKENQKATVVIKLINPESINPSQIAKLRYEYTLTKQLRETLQEQVINPLEIIQHNNFYGIVYEDFGGISLDKALKTHVLDLKKFLELAIKITETVGSIHALDVLIKDLNPSNILWNPLTDEVKLIDFGISSTLSYENLNINFNNIIEGNLSYISPEQTGYMNRHVDYRSDYYSLGITFYEMLTGKMLFKGRDTRELIHAHISHLPVHPHMVNSDIPLAVSNLVMKLLNKVSEERYQSAHGIIWDLKECLRQLNEKKAISLFALGTKDISSTFHISEKLYGRDKEIFQILESFEKSSQGAAELLLVSGGPGTGKTALINEVHKPIAAKRGYFISGKFEQYKSNIPYESLVQGFKKVVQQILNESPESILQWKTVLQKAVGRNGKLVTDVIPEVKLIIGPQPEIVDVGPTETKNRFSFVFLNFIQAFASKKHPLTIFLDDLQWVDLPTLELLNHLFTSPSTHHLLLIGAFRKNEVGESHILRLTLGDLKNAGVNFKEIEILPLQMKDVKQLIMDTLDQDPSKTRSLAEFCYSKTQGNPFFLNQMLYYLAEEELLKFDIQEGAWQWDIETIRATDIPDNVVTFLSKKILKLPQETRNVLELASCLGNHFELKALAQANEKTMSETASELWPALKDGLIIPETTNYKFIDNQMQATVHYRFLHDRVQQATYSLIPESKKSNLHYKIGTLLYENTPKNEIEEKVFDIINQLNLGSEFIISQADKYQMIHLNFLASKKAQASSAFKAATTYLKIATGFLNSNAWETQYKLAFDLLKEYSTNLYITGEHEVAERLIEEILLHAKTNLEKAEILAMQVTLLMTSGKMEEAIEAGLKGLKLLGVNYSRNPSQLILFKELVLTKWNLGNREIASLIDMPLLENPKNQLIIKLLQETSIATFYVGNTILTGCLILKQVNISLKNGNYAGASLAYNAFSLILITLGKMNESFEFGKLSLALCERFHDEQYKCRILVTYSMMVHGWNYHWKTLTSYFREAIDAGLQSGDVITSLHGSSYLLLWDPEINLQNVVAESHKYLHLIKQTRNQNAWDATKVEFQLRANLCGLTEGRFSLSSPDFNEYECLERMKKGKLSSGLALYYKSKAILHYHYDDFAKSLEFIREAEEHIDSMAGTLFYAEYCFYAFYIHAAAYTNENWWQKKKIWQELRKYYKKVKKWSDHCTVNFIHHKVLMEAEMARINKDFDLASKLYDQAIKLAKQNEFIRYEALANELTARFYVELKRDKIAKIYLLDALECYQKWGATGKVQQLEEAYHNYLPPSHVLGLSKTTTIPSTEEATTHILDFISIMKASQALTREIQLPKLIEKMMHVVIENAGAEKGILILEKKGSLVIEAIADSERVHIQPSTLVNLPLSIIEEVETTKEAIVLGDATAQEKFKNDPYILQNQPKSILCSPLINLGVLKGMLYLENNLAKDVFTSEQLDVINMLTTQMAISIDNALFYGQLEEKVQERTQALRETEHQLLQKEKMAFLGMLTTGIANEIKKPLKFIIDSSVASLDLINEVDHFIYKHHLEGNPQVQDSLSTLKENANYILEQGNKAEVIINRMIEHSADKNQSLTLTNLHELLERSLELALQEILKQYSGFIVKIVKDFELNRSSIQISEKDIQRVLVHLFTNALYALYQKKKQLGEKFEPELAIRTLDHEDQCEIHIIDNGVGIPVDLQNKIFTPFFTTKPPGQGTGLGLSLCYNIIVEEHGGHLSFKSNPGDFTEFVIILPRQPFLAHSALIRRSP